MALLADFICEVAVNPGVSTTINLAGVASGSFKTFASSFATGARVYYGISDEIGAREDGVGTFTAGSPNTLSRDTVYTNTSGTTARLNFSGTVFVYNILPASRAVFLDQNGNVNVSGLVGTANPGVGNAILSPGDATHPGTVGFYNAAGTRVGYAGTTDGSNHLFLGAENGFTGWYIPGTLRVDGALTGISTAAFTGNVSSQGQISTTTPGTAGNINSANRVRATVGAISSGDGNACPILADFFNVNTANSHVTQLPNGVILQNGNATPPSGNADSVVFPTTFPTVCTFVNVRVTGDVGTTPVAHSIISMGVTSFSIRVVRWNGSSFVTTGGIGLRWFAMGF